VWSSKELYKSGNYSAGDDAVYGRIVFFGEQLAKLCGGFKLAYRII